MEFRVGVMSAVLLAAGCGGESEAGGVEPGLMSSGGGVPGSSDSTQGATTGDPSNGLGQDGSGAQTGSFSGEVDGGVDEVPDQSAHSDLVGHYALRTRASATANVMFVGEIRSQLTSYGLVEVVLRDGQLQWRERTCRSSAEDGAVQVADEVVQSIPPALGQLAVWETDGEREWARPTMVTSLGFHDDDPRLPLPTDKDDERVFDQDGDGHPGVTVHVETDFASGDTYVVQRLAATMEGRVEAGKLLGTQVSEAEQNVLDATNPLLKISVPFNYDPSGDNSVQLVAVDGPWSCDDLLGQDAHLGLFD